MSYGLEERGEGEEISLWEKWLGNKKRVGGDSARVKFKRAKPHRSPQAAPTDPCEGVLAVGQLYILVLQSFIIT